MTPATWYFDFISPFAYLQFGRLPSLSTEFDITLKPVLFSAMLKHWGQKGPAEISSKRRCVYRFFKWQADRRGIPFIMPAVHPFNPLPPLRLAIAAGPTMNSVRMIFHHIYGEGNATDSAATLAALASSLGIDDVERSLSGACVKDTLRANTQAAIAQGVFESTCPPGIGPSTISTPAMRPCMIARLPQPRARRNSRLSTVERENACQSTVSPRELRVELA